MRKNKRKDKYSSNYSKDLVRLQRSIPLFTLNSNSEIELVNFFGFWHGKLGHPNRGSASLYRDVRFEFSDSMFGVAAKIYKETIISNNFLKSAPTLEHFEKVGLYPNQHFEQAVKLLVHSGSLYLTKFNSLWSPYVFHRVIIPKLMEVDPHISEKEIINSLLKDRAKPKKTRGTK